MRRVLRLLTMVVGSLASAVSYCQNGILGTVEISPTAFEGELSQYLNGDEIKSVLTPGESSEFDLKLKAGQVVIGEARSDDFDPALEIVNESKAVLVANDDRYPGDQRPLLFWRCDHDGTVKLRVRSFHDKAGGLFYTRFKVYDSIDLSSGEKVDREIDVRNPILIRVPMKAGQIKEVICEAGGASNYLGLNFNRVIAPGGFPDINLSQPIRPINGSYTLMAAADGDYYTMESPAWSNEIRRRVHVWAHEIVPCGLVKNGDSYSSSVPTRMPTVWQLPVKAGDIIRASTLGLDPSCVFVASEVPDISKVNLSNPEANPFVPRPTQSAPDPGPAFDQLPSKKDDVRIMVLRIRRDAKLWFASNGLSPEVRQYTLSIAPAATDMPVDTANAGKLTIGNTDYWSFDSQPGDVMTFSSETPGFRESVVVRDPDFREIRRTMMTLDQTSDNWRMIAQKPGRYLIAVSCAGDGGSGDYSISRKVLHPQSFSLGHPARGEISEGQIQAWVFSAKPGKPLFLHWNSTNWSFSVDVYDEKGNPANLQRTEVDSHNQFGILKVTKPQSFVIILTGVHDKASYSIDIKGLPRFRG